MGEYPVRQCIESLKKQAADIEIIVEEQEVEEFINKNRLYNKGIARSSGEIIWFCDADYTLDDPNFLENMSDELDEVIYPCFYSRAKKDFKIADGGPMFKREVIERHGPLDESLIGISWVTFPFLKWCMDNTNFKYDKRFIINHHNFKIGRTRHQKTSSKLRPIYKEVGRKLDELSDM